MKLQRLIIIFLPIALLILVLSVDVMRDDYVVREYLAENVSESRGGIWLYSSRKMLFRLEPAREYVFRVGSEEVFEVIVRKGEVVDSHWSAKLPLPLPFTGFTDFRVFSKEKWR